MDSPRSLDPFLWDVETVVQKLGHAPCSWAEEPAALISTLRAEEIDGKTLLTYEHIFPEEDFISCLGLQLDVHKNAFGAAIAQLQTTSPAYHQWIDEFRRKRREEDAFPSNVLHDMACSCRAKGDSSGRGLASATASSTIAWKHELACVCLAEGKSQRSLQRDHIDLRAI